MSFNFSPQLIKRTVEYFKKKYSLDISDETANEYLDSMSGLYLAFARPPVTGGGQTPCTGDD